MLLRSLALEGPRTRLVSRWSRFEQESLSSWVTLVVEDRVYRLVLRRGAVGVLEGCILSLDEAKINMVEH